MDQLNIDAFSSLATITHPYAEAVLRGNENNQQIGGTVRFYPAAGGTLLIAEVFGLPLHYRIGDAVIPAGPFYGFHVHEGAICGLRGEPNPFTSSGMHYNPKHLPHPLHAGDLPPLMADHGYAYMSIFTDRFTPEQVVHRTIVLHAHPDDFKSQPSGSAGQKLACGEIIAR